MFRMKNTSIKIMILGIALILVGIYIQNEPGLRQITTGWEVIIVLLGFILIICGLVVKD